MKVRLILLFAGLLLVAVSCSSIGAPTTVAGPTDPGATPTNAPEVTEPPPVTEAPPATEAPDTTVPEDGEANSTPWWLLAIVAGAFLLLLIAFINRGSQKKVIVGQPVVTWKDSARMGYADARWLYDALSEDLAIWRGNATFDETAGVGATAATSLAQTWQQLESRLGKASDNLYALEASAPDQRTAEQANTTIASMRGVRRAVDDRAESRMNYRTVETSESTAQSSLQDAREREVRSSRALAEARTEFGTALTNLSTLL